MLNSIFLSTIDFISTQQVKRPQPNKNKPSEKDQVYYFKYFTLAAILFLIGLGTVLYVNLLLPDSEEQELLALIGLIFSVPSGLMAFYCYLRLLLARFQHFLKK